MRYSILWVTLMVSMTATAQQTVTITGKIESLVKGDKVYLQQAIGGDFSDSLVATGKIFSFTTPIEKGGLYSIRSVGATRSSVMLYLQPGKVMLKGKTLTDARFSGSTYIREFDRFSQTMKKHSLLKKYAALSEQYNTASRNKDTVLRNKLLPELRSLSPVVDSVRTAIATKWLEAHPQSDINAYIAYMYFRYKKNHDELKTMLNGFSAAARNSAIAEKMYHSIEIATITAVGNMAPDFTQNDPNGKPVSLKDFRGKYVLVDFWASWCGPCRAENPNVVAAYKKFESKNFTVLGVSLDNNKAKWLEAIEKDGLEWTHVSDLKYWNNAVAKQYDINAIPANLLIDPSGKIVAKNLRGETLHKKLDELLQ
jgi:peroxiredoxin